MKKTIAALMMLFVSIIIMAGNKPDQMSILISADWTPPGATLPNWVNMHVRFTSTQRITSTVIDGKTQHVARDYYFSDKVENFNVKKVGRYNSGKYLIVESSGKDASSCSNSVCYEIKHISDAEIILEVISKPNEIVYSDQVFRYFAINQ